MTLAALGQQDSNPSVGIIACVQHDSNELTQVARAVRFDAAGTFKIAGGDGVTASFTVFAGEWWSGVQIRQVFDTGTTLTDAQICLWR